MKRLIPFFVPKAVPTLALWLAAAPALASFHLMKIEQAIGGVGGDTSQQAIQLRMRAAGQNLVGGTSRLRAWDAAGTNPVTLVSFPSNVANGATGARILVVSPAFAAAQAGISEDFTMTNTIPASYLAAGRLTFESATGTIYWSLAWGGAAYTGSNTGTLDNDGDGSFGPPFGPPLPSAGLQALRFTAPDPTGSAPSTTNAADYGLSAGPAVFTSNAGASGTVTLPPADTDLSVTKSDGGLEGRFGFPLTYTITVTNQGPAGVSGATLTDDFPAGLSGVSWTCTASAGSACPAGGTGTIAASLTLLVGGTATFTATGTVAAGAASPLVNTAIVMPPAGVTDLDPSDNTATTSTVVAEVEFYTATPCRVADTRDPAGDSGGPALAANAVRTFPVRGLCSVPADARAVILNVAVVGPTDAGDLRLFPSGMAAPLASTINFQPGAVRANNAIIGLGTDGRLAVQCDMPAGSTGTAHFLIDISGYFR
jgi:uncharacterized repeat protein (TIGR01451 family)